MHQSLLRFFVLDSRAVEKGIQTIVSNGVRNIEILPGIVAAKVAPKIRVHAPETTIVAAGLIDSVEEIEMLKNHVDGVSTSSTALWTYRW